MPPGTISERMIDSSCFSQISCQRSSLKGLFLKDPSLKIQGDASVWLGTAYEHVPGSGPLQRLRVIRNRSANKASHAGMTDSSPARPSDRNIARFRQFKQTSEFRIPSGGNPATRE